MSYKKLLSSSKVHTYDPIGSMVEKFSQVTSSRAFSDEKIGSMALATESIDSNSETLLINTYNNLESTIKTIAQDLGVSLESYQLESATMAAIYATNPKLFLSTKPKLNVQNAIVQMPKVSDGLIERDRISLEAYDERENKNAQLFSILYNLLASRQDDFGETFFPTIVVNPTEVGVTILVRLYYVYNDFKRAVTGALANYGRKNIIRAYADHSILYNELTRAIPVLRDVTGSADYNADKFLTDITPWSVSVGNSITIKTAPLKVDQKIDLIGISQTDELLNSGLMGPSDTLDTYIKLDHIYLAMDNGQGGKCYFEIPLEGNSASTFTYAPQGNYRKMILTMDTDSIVVDENTRVIGTLPSALATAFTNKVKFRLSVQVNGSAILDKGDVIVNRGTVGFVIARDKDGNIISDPSAYASLFVNSEIAGYTITAYRANSNIRQRGQLLDNQTEYRVINVPWRSPISVIMPAINSGDDNSAIQTLINATGIRISNDAVTTLIKTAINLKSYVPVPDANGVLPTLDVIGEFYVNPVYFEEDVDLTNVVDSLKSHERIKDIRAALVEKIRYYANEMYRRSEYKAAAGVLTGNMLFKPTVIVGTDPVIYNYIMVDGDLRTLGDTFDIKVVSTLDKRVTGKIFVTFSVFDSSRNTSVNPLSFGNLLYSPEITVNLPSVSRDGQVSRELIVAPRYLHINNLPVLTVLNVTGLPDTVNKVSVNTRPL